MSNQAVINKHDLYLKAFYKMLDEYENEPKLTTKKLIVYGVKAVNTAEKPEYTTKEYIVQYFNLSEMIKLLMSTLTPNEFMNIYPVEKQYDGHRWQTKDYFYTMNYVKGLDPDKPIGEEINDFLWDYMNTDIHVFLANLLGLASDLRRLETGKGIMEEWAEKNGIKTFTKHTDSNGKEYLVDNETGKTMRVKKPRPKHLKVVR
ncbi:phage infection protein [Pseudoclostridium thermosuccinogenes]|uniref:phage infection protein n=1 Tax=Clostridium thermosuccinogenes TaxID=84032 RepID=UPI002FDB2662